MKCNYKGDNMITGNTINYIKKQSEQEDFDFQIQDNFDE